MSHGDIQWFVLLCIRFAKWWVPHNNADPVVYTAYPWCCYVFIELDEGLLLVLSSCQSGKVSWRCSMICVMIHEICEILGCTHQCWSLSLDGIPMLLVPIYRAWRALSSGVTTVLIGQDIMEIFDDLCHSRWHVWVSCSNSHMGVYLAYQLWWYVFIELHEGFPLVAHSSQLGTCLWRYSRVCMETYEIWQILGCTHQWWSLGLDGIPVSMVRLYITWWGLYFVVKFVPIGKGLMEIFNGLVLQPRVSTKFWVPCINSDPWVWIAHTW